MNEKDRINKIKILEHIIDKTREFLEIDAESVAFELIDYIQSEIDWLKTEGKEYVKDEQTN